MMTNKSRRVVKSTEIYFCLIQSMELSAAATVHVLEIDMTLEGEEEGGQLENANVMRVLSLLWAQLKLLIPTSAQSERNVRRLG